ncbi:hypothetical protein [uncultured Methanobrevibacter sp.]|uniref:hypothetical protein n=1 Tax=uncultured Methanobrevibacter sp. TaxID=253161 RepID=UPI0025CBAE38|nr:hypothetical protein [uncultured Methanobrevibacter sp.]
MSLSTYFHINLIMSAATDARNKYNVSTAAFDQTFKQNRNAKIAIAALIISLLFFENLESFRAYLILKNAYVPIIIPNMIPIIKYS